MIPLNKINNTHTLGEAKEALRNEYERGAPCPCCKQHVQMYRRSITSSMAAALCLIVAHKQVGEHFHLENFLKTYSKNASMRGDAAKLVHWHLLDRQAGKKEDGNPNTGMYSLTMAGFQFVKSRKLVPKYVQIYNGKVWEFEKDKFTDVFSCLGNKFNYNELMNALSTS